MTKTKILAGLLATTVFTSAFAANVPEGTTLAAEQSITWRLLDEPDSLDPGKNEGVDGSNIIRNLFEGLYSQDESGNLVPALATGYEVSEDKLTYTISLRDDANWSNGTPITANDFVYAWKRVANPETASPYSWFIELMSVKNAGAVIAGEMPVDDLGVSAPDDHTLVVELSTPLPYFPQTLTHSTTFPVPQAVVEEFGDAWTKPENMVSNGAYTLEEHVAKERFKLVRNENYWDNEHTVINDVTGLIINDINTAVTRFKAGELDIVDEVPNGQYPTLQSEMPDQVFSVPYLCTYYYAINLREDSNPALLNKDVRQALSLAIDRDILVDQVLQGGQFPAYTFTPGATAGFDVPEVPAASMTQAERLAKAQELMAGAGYGEGGEPLELRLLYNTNEIHKQVAVVVSQMWKQAFGAEITLENLEWQVYLDTRAAGGFDVSRAGWCGDYNEASTFLDLVNTTSGSNDAKYDNPVVDQLLADSKLMEDPTAAYTEIEQILAEDLPNIPLYHYSHNIMLDANLKGWPFDNVQQNWYAKDMYFVE